MQPGFSNSPCSVFAYHSPLFGLKNSVTSTSYSRCIGEENGLTGFLMPLVEMIDRIAEILKRHDVDDTASQRSSLP